MKSPRRQLTSLDHSLLLTTSLNPTISTKERLRNDRDWQEMGQQDHKFLWLPSICLDSLPPIFCVLLNHMSSPALDGLPPLQALTGQTPDISFYSIFPSGNLSTSVLTIMNPLPTFLPLPMKRKATGLVSLTMLVTNLPGNFSLRIPNTLSSDLLSGVQIPPPLIFVMSCLQGRAIILTPTLPLTKIHQTSLNRISCGVSQSVKPAHHSILIPHLCQLSLWMI